MSDFEVASTGANKKYTETELALAHAKELLKVAKCPNEGCGGQGWSAHQVAEGVWEQEQCQFCAERKALLADGE
jgi:hypothetical protein